MTRAKLAQTVAQGGGRHFLEGLARRYDVRYWSFHREAQPLGVDPVKLKLPEPPSPGGPSTRIGDAVARVLDEAAGRQVAGVLLFSDGQNNGGRSPGDVAVSAATAGTPIFAIPVGSRKRLRDVAIVDLYATSLVTVDDTARVAVTIESNGFDKRPVKVELRDGEMLLDMKE